MAAAWDIIASMLGGPAPPASPAPLPHEVAAAAAPLRSPLPWMQFMPAPGAPMPAPPEAQRLRSPAADPEPDRDESAPAAKKNRAGVELGCFGERWRRKCSRDSVVKDLGDGCSKGCGCVWKLNIAEVMEQRQINAGLLMSEQRDDCRNFLLKNAKPSSKFGFFLHANNVERPLCVAGFDVFNGYTAGYTYRRAREVRAGISQDDVQGGSRYKGTKVSDLADDDSAAFMSAFGWLGDLREETEVMPNTRERQLDWVEHNELYREYVTDSEEAGSTKGAIASFATWKRVWELHFTDLKIREQKAVSGKHRKRSELRRLLRRTVTANATDRAYIKHVRHEYRHSARRERCFYWESRLAPPKYPEVYMTNISDGATQSDYILPKIVQFEVGKKGLQMKLNATIYHGHCLVLHIVHPHIPGDANLTCHIIDTSLEVYCATMREKGYPGHVPPNNRFQMDGVSTNWGVVTFAHLQNLKDGGVLGDDVDACRNPVGDTHEDVDAIFGVGHEHLKDKDIMDPYELDRELKVALANYKLPVTILHVDATFDYKSFYEGHLNSDLAGFGYSETESGSHWLKLSDSMFAGHGAAFKKWQSETYVDVAISREDLEPADRPPVNQKFLPVLVLVTSPFRPAKILNSNPTGKPAVAAFNTYDYDATDRSLDHFIANHSINTDVRQTWRTWLAARPRKPEDAPADCLPTWNWTRVPDDAASGSHRSNARTRAMAGALQREAPNRIVNNAAEANALRRMNAATAAASQEATMMRLEPGTFVLVKMEYEAAGGCQIPLILAELPDPLPRGESNAAEFKVKVKWWEPEPQPRHPQKGTFDAKWRRWKERAASGRGQVHAESEVTRDRMALVGARFTREAELAGGFRKLSAATLAKVRELPDSRYDDFSSPS